jgi:predicted methyltransferase
MMRKTVLTATAAVLAVATCNPVNAQADPAAIAAAVADAQRPAEDTARDALRKPAEIAPGGGYYTRILAKAVGSEGKVYALMPAFFANRPGGMDRINALAAQYPNVEVVVADYADLDLPEPVDLVWTTENYHDIANGDIAAINSEVYEALKSGGIYFVEDHSAPGTGMEATSTLHRIDPEAVKQQVTEAGFALEAESDLLHNPADPHDVSPREVEPTSDKFALRFRKPD